MLRLHAPQMHARAARAGRLLTEFMMLIVV